MKHRRTLSLIVVVVAVLSSAVPTAARAGGKLGVSVADCTTGSSDEERAAAFTGTMTAAGAKRMLMRFTLSQRVGSGPKGTFRKVAVPGWGSWERSDPGRSAFVFTKRIEALTAPAGYRVAVAFRWLDGRGHVVRTATRTSSVCEVPDPRPDLVVAGVDAMATGASGASGAVYSVAVANEGHSEAVPFAVTVKVGDVVSSPVIVGPLGAGDRIVAAVGAPRCVAGSTITVTLDGADAVDESVESDDVVQRPCPLA